MKNLKELRAALNKKRSDGRSKMEAYNALAGKDKRTDDEDKSLAALETDLNALEADVEKLNAEIETEEKKARRAALFASTAGGPRIEVTRGEPNPAATNGFHSLAEFARAVRLASTNISFDDRLNAAPPANVHQSGGNAGEGYLVPAEYRQTIWEMVFSGYDLLPLFNPEPTAANMVNIVKDETTPWGAVGVQAYWRSEGQVMTASKLSMSGSTVPLHELFAFVGATDELLSDAPLLQNRLTVKAAAAIRFRASKAIYEGPGAGQPQGFMNSPALITQAAEGGQAAGTLNIQNIAKMITRLQPSSLGGAFWMASSEILPQLITLQIGSIPVFTPPNAGATQAPAGFIMGRPLMFAEHNSPLGQVGDIVLVDPAGYYAVTKQGGGIDFAASIHLWFDQALTAFRWIFRIGGQPLLSQPIAPAKGALTKSHFVTLAAR